MAYKTVGVYMENVRGFTTGFDYLRIGLSIAVLTWHSFTITNISGSAPRALPAMVWVMLPMFFSLSGFLVSASLVRNPDRLVFLWLRFVRLFPALVTEVLLSALVLGPLVTSLSFFNYLADSEFHAYFWNVIGHAQLTLPGVFPTNPQPGVMNTSLWTVPYELECYIALIAVSLATLIRRPRLLALMFVIALGVVMAWQLSAGVAVNTRGHLDGRQLVLCFLAGVVLYLNRDILPRSALLAIVCALATAFLIRGPYYVLAIPSLAYLTVWIGLLQPKKIPILMGGDYSYGMYLYAFPIQQAVCFFTDFGKTYAGNLVLSLVITTFFAAFSWHLIEKPSLRYKNIFNKPKASVKAEPLKSVG